MFWLNKHMLVYALRWWSAVLRDSVTFFFGLKMILMDKKLSVKAKKIKWVFEAFFFFNQFVHYIHNTVAQLPESDTDMTISGADQMVCALGCRNITQTQELPASQNPE